MRYVKGKEFIDVDLRYPEGGGGDLEPWYSINGGPWIKFPGETYDLLTLAREAKDVEASFKQSLPQ